MDILSWLVAILSILSWFLALFAYFVMFYVLVWFAKCSPVSFCSSVFLSFFGCLSLVLSLLAFFPYVTASLAAFVEPELPFPILIRIFNAHLLQVVVPSFCVISTHINIGKAPPPPELTLAVWLLEFGRS